MFDINQIYKLENFLSEEERTAFSILCSHYTWELLGVSHTNDRKFWLKDMWESNLGKCEQIESTFRTKLETIFNIKLETERMYLNGQAHGQCGSIHVDNNSDQELDNYITVVYYANDVWSPEYGGFTLIMDSDNENIQCINYPEPNSILLFNSKLPHVGLEPTVHCKSQRVTLAHKLKVIK